MLKYNYFALSFLSKFFFNFGFDVNKLIKKLPLKVNNIINPIELVNSTKIFCMSKKFLFFKYIINTSQLFVFNTFFTTSLLFDLLFIKSNKRLTLSHYINIKIRKPKIFKNYHYNISIFFKKYKPIRKIFFYKDVFKSNLKKNQFVHKKSPLIVIYYKNSFYNINTLRRLSVINILQQTKYLKKEYFNQYFLSYKVEKFNNHSHDLLSISSDKTFNLFLKSIINLVNLCYSLKNCTIIKNSQKLPRLLSSKKSKLYFKKKRFIHKTYNISSPIVSKNLYNSRNNYFSRR